ncbi:queuosine precursor transporter [Hugenholtzia roseola]|uniref:queuosine precursor transporter n=1 Tax=Hugenholtzia roseola TaxID=1002 RepID=UPI0004271FE3|nr:queuosine precursor transporter [Hugenholtzia roseola]
MNKRQTLFLLLASFFLTNVILAEIIGTKIFSLEASLGLSPFAIQFPFFEQPLAFNLTAGVVLWPFVFITTDLINEYFGKAGVRYISSLAALLIVYIFVMLWLVAGLSPAEFWVQINQPLDINLAFERIFLQSLGIIVGSLLAFLIGQFIDVSIFQGLRRLTGSKKIWLRATGSTLVSQFIDSFVVLWVAFYLLGQPAWSLEQVLAVGLVNYCYKFVIAILLTPLLYVAHWLIDAYLGKSTAEALMEEAAQSRLF